MKYLSTFEVAEKWGISHRRVGILCNENRIPGAHRAGAVSYTHLTLPTIPWV